MKSKSNLYELILTPQETCQFPQMPTSSMLQQALPGCLCSHLFVAGFSCKPLDLCCGVVAQTDGQYQLLKRLKSARYIQDSVRFLSAGSLLQQLEDGTLTVKNGYIGYDRNVAGSVRTVRLCAGDRLFGIELSGGKSFRCFVKTKNPDFPQVISLQDCRFSLQKVLPLEPEIRDRYVLQQDLPVIAGYRVSADSASRFKLSYDAASQRIVVCAGSVISREDHFGDGIAI